MINDVIDKIVQYAWNEDSDSQQFYVDKICLNVRKMESDIIRKACGLYIPNNDYISNIVGDDAFSTEAGMYAGGQCIWQNRLVLPVTDVGGKYVGFVGFDPFNYLASKEGEEIGRYYSYSPKSVFKKGDYFYCINGTFERAYNDGYVVITDGVFDTLSLAKNGINAMALMGSVLNDTLLAQLRFIDKVIIAMDNDHAGSRLVDKMRNHLDNVVVMKHQQYKDVDDVLKSEYRQVYLDELNKIIQHSFAVDKCVVLDKNLLTV